MRGDGGTPSVIERLVQRGQARRRERLALDAREQLGEQRQIVLRRLDARASTWWTRVAPERARPRSPRRASRRASPARLTPR